MLTREKLVEILASHASDASLTLEDAQRIAVHRGRCGSPFRYKVVKVDEDYYFVVIEDDACLYVDLLQAVTRG